MKRSELKQLIREVIEEVEGSDSYEIDGLNIRFNFVVGTPFIQYDSPVRRNWFEGAVEELEYNKKTDFLSLQGKYSVEVDYEKKQGRFAFMMKNFVKGNTVATAQTTGDGILRGFWQNDNIYDDIPKSAPSKGANPPIFIPDDLVLRYLKEELPKNTDSFKFKNFLEKLGQKFRPTI